MSGVTEDRESGSVQVAIEWRRSEATQEPDEAIGTASVQGFQDGTRTEYQKGASYFRERVVPGRKVLVVGSPAKTPGHVLRRSHVRCGECGEAGLSGQIVGKEGVGEEAAMRSVEED